MTTTETLIEDATEAMNHAKWHVATHIITDTQDGYRLANCVDFDHGSMDDEGTYYGATNGKLGATVPYGWTRDDGSVRDEPLGWAVAYEDGTEEWG